jgi:hypothetical protein
MKILVILSIICLVSCEFHVKLNNDCDCLSASHINNKDCDCLQNSKSRILFRKDAAVYGHLGNYPNSNNLFINTFFGDGSFSAKLAVSTFDNYIWIPTTGCTNSPSGACSSNPYGCSAAPCKVTSKNVQENGKSANFASLFTN